MKDCILDLNEIHCWVIDLDEHIFAVSRYLLWLSDAEKCRAERFAFKLLKERYIVSHGVLNMLLAGYLRSSQFEIAFSKYGKPFIKNSDVYFNLSHSNRYACIAFANFEVGVDIEHMKQDSVIESIFSENEKYHFDTIADAMKLQAFYQAWVRKESYLKAIGTGLAQSIQAVEVGFKTPSDWFFSPISISEDYTGCIATKARSSPKIKWCGIGPDFLI
ncbi:MAG: 4'-phosphopantetheinyl transferase superfamily protein [Parachlamydiaceae bacterium]|nr:4'-phosphopantetheinyl transferase superfamily protein [Parachlamydiaceae bacterium]